MKVKRISLLIILLIGFSVSLFAQETTPCLTVEAQSEGEIHMEGDSIIFLANILGKMDSSQPEYKWLVSDGSIIEGQGTPVIRVSTVGIGGKEIIATVEIKNFPQNCENKSSATAIVEKRVPIEDVFPMPYKNLNDLKVRVAMIETELELASSKPNYIVLLYYKPAKPSKNNFNSFRLNLKKLLLKSKNIDLSKILLVDSEKDSGYPDAEIAAYWFYNDKEPFVNRMFGKEMPYINIFGKEVKITNLEK